MREFCIYCGAELRENARFCAKCGKPVQRAAAQPQAAQTNAPEQAPPAMPAPVQYAPKKVREKGAALEKMRFITERYILRGITLLACLIVFISGFFINIAFMPMEQVQSKVTIDVSGGSAELEGMLSTTSFDQNVFNVFGALTVPLGGSENEYQKIVDSLSSRVTDIVAGYESEITRLAAQIEAGSERAAEQLVDLFGRIVRDIASSVKDINLIKLDRLEAELATNVDTSDGSTYVSENLLKRADDGIVRSAVMVGYPAGVVYLQVVSLVFLITTAVGMFTGKKFSGGKFFTMYLCGFVFLFLIAQLSATSIGGAGIFCFAFAAVMLLLYLAGKVFSMRGMTAEKIVSVSASGLAAVFSFAALCTLFGAAFEFGGLVDKIGAVFGLYTFSSAELVFGEGPIITASNLAVFGGVYLVLLALTSLVFFLSVSNLTEGRHGRVKEIVLTSVALAVAFTSYVAFFVFAEQSVLDLLYAPAAFVVAGVLLLCTLAACIVGGPVSKAVSHIGASPSANGNAAVPPVYPPYADCGAPYAQAPVSPAYAETAATSAQQPADVAAEPVQPVAEPALSEEKGAAEDVPSAEEGESPKTE